MLNINESLQRLSKLEKQKEKMESKIYDLKDEIKEAVQRESDSLASIAFN